MKGTNWLPGLNTERDWSRDGDFVVVGSADVFALILDTNSWQDEDAIVVGHDRFTGNVRIFPENKKLNFKKIKTLVEVL